MVLSGEFELVSVYRIYRKQTWNKPTANFYLAPTRTWELLAGSICAFLQYGKAQKSNNLLSALGLALIVFAIFLYDESTPFPSVYSNGLCKEIPRQRH